MLKHIAAAAIAIGLLSGSSAHAEQILKIGYIYPEKSQFGAGALAFAGEIAKRTNGKYRIEQYPSASLGDEIQTIKGVQDSQIEVAFVSSVTFAKSIPEFGILDIPFLFRDAQHACTALDGPVGQEYLKKISQLNVVALAWGENGLRHMTNSKRPLRTPADLAGLKLRVPQSPIMVEAFQSLGMQVEPMAFPPLYHALETGRFDAEENPIATIVSNHFEKVQKYLTMSGHIYSWAVIIMSKEAYDELSPEEKAAFAEAARIGGNASRKYAQEIEKQGVEALRAAGMEVNTIDHEAFAAAMKPAYDKFAERFGAEQIERLRNSH